MHVLCIYLKTSDQLKYSINHIKKSAVDPNIGQPVNGFKYQFNFKLFGIPNHDLVNFFLWDCDCHLTYP